MIKQAFEVNLDVIYMYLCWIFQLLSADNGKTVIEVLISFNNDDALPSYSKLLSVLREEYPLNTEFNFGCISDGHDSEYNWLLRTTNEPFQADDLVKVCLIKFSTSVPIENLRGTISSILIKSLVEAMFPGKD
jgi:hypothetical protein